ncbi:MAG: hybrid sensor histidine kinase/response regulator [Myxococcales bacterium]
MHKLLERQIQRHLRGAPAPELAAFLAAIDEAYRGSDEDRRQLERSLELSSGEMLALNTRLQREVEGERQARENLAQDQRDFLEIIQRIPFPTAIRRGGQLVFANRAWAALLGLEPEALIGRAILEDVLEEDQPAVAADLAAADVGDQLRPLSARWRRKDGASLEVEMHTVWRLDFQGAPSVLLAAIDVTERKRLQAQIVTADRMVSVGTLAAGVAHEINNPLAYVLSNLEYVASELGTLLRSEGQQEILQALAEARQGVQRVREIVRDLKTFSRSDEERRARVDLHGILQSAANMARNEVRHRAKLVMDLRPVPEVFGNEGKLGQVFLNLIVNAAQAMPDGAAEKNEIRVACRTGPGGEAVVEVADTGCGIPEALLRRIFTPFFTTKPIGEGTGLGLSICQGIVHAHQGQLEVESEVGRGSTFRVTLPAAAEASPAAEAEGAARAVPASPRRRVLVVDDEANVGAALRRALAAWHDVVTTASAREALALLLRGERFDAILCDVMMPEMTGEDLHRELQRLRPELAARMIFMSGGAFSHGARQFLDRVENRCVEKPVETDALRALLAGLPIS